MRTDAHARSIWLALSAVALCVLLICALTLTACSRANFEDAYKNDLEDATIEDGSVKLHGVVGDTNVHYAQSAFRSVLQSENSSASLTAWKGDSALSQIALIAENAQINNVKLTSSDFVCGDSVIPSSDVRLSFVDETLAYTGLPKGTKPSDTPSDSKDKVLVPDIISGSDVADIPRNSLKSVWMEIDVAPSTPAGVYIGSVTACGDSGGEATFDYALEVLDVALPSREASGFALEFWQYPYNVAEYYNVEPFSDEHIDILKAHMAAYRDLGADAIVCSVVDDAWGGQTYSANEVRYPSMVKWIKQADGTFSYDFSVMDKWISLNKELGIGNKIVLYSIATWAGQIRYFDVQKGKTVALTPTFGSPNWAAMWKDFLQNAVDHLEAKCWFDGAYMGMDERGYSAATMQLVNSVKNSEGRSLKISVAFNSIDNATKLALSDSIDDLSVSSKAVKKNPDIYEKLAAERDAQGKTTTIYTCTTHFPNNLALSMPGESYWIALFCASQNADGYLRWAFDAWTEDPLKDATHWNYEAGDCFLVYPGDEETGYAPRMSVRLSKLLEGVRDVQKLKFIKENMPSLADEVDAIFAQLRVDYSYLENKGAIYADEATKAQLPKDLAAIKSAIDALTKKYISAAV